MISYAQNHEDVVLARAFADQPRGFYLDIGAEHPRFNSVTKHFYDRGWRGINVEPAPSALVVLQHDRPDDVNLGCGIADTEGKRTFYEGPPDNHGASTFRPDLVADYERSGQVFTAIDDVPVTTLALLCEEYVGDRSIDFLKIDVEGLEGAVIAGADWARWRPRVLVVESTQPQTRIPTHGEWEPLLLGAGYVFALFDGVNRFYARADEPELRERLGSPACVLDDFVDAVHLDALDALQATTAERDELVRQVDELLRQLEAGRAEATELGRQLAGARAETEELSRQLRTERATAALVPDLERRVRELLRELHSVQDRLAVAYDDVRDRDAAAIALREAAATEHARRLTTEQERDDARRAATVAQDQLDALLATRTFRWTRELRRAYGALRRFS